MEFERPASAQISKSSLFALVSNIAQQSAVLMCMLAIE
jgi:hypothetical protein